MQLAKRRLTVFLAGAAFVGGCAHYQPQPINSEAIATSFASRALTTPELQRFVEQNLGRAVLPWPPAAWDLQLLTQVALYYQSDLELSRAELRVAEAGTITAGARPNPSVGLGGEYNRDADRGTSPWKVDGLLEVPFETAGKRSYRIEHAQHLADAARYHVADSVWRVRSGVRASLLGLVSTESIVRKQADLQEQLIKLLERRLALGAVSQPELTRARIALNQRLLAVGEAQKQSAEHRAHLATALGVPVSALGAIAVSLDAFEHLPDTSALDEAALRSQALISRPEILASLAEYEASEAALRLEIAKQYPDFRLGPGYSWDAGQSKWLLALTLVLPVFDRNQGPIAEASARREQAAANVVAVQARILGELEAAFAGLRWVAEKLATADAMLSSLKENERSIARQFQVGEVSRKIWLEAQLETAAAELARQETLIQAQQVLGALEDAVHQSLAVDASNTVATDLDRRLESLP